MILWKERGSRVGRFSCVEARGGGGRRGVAVFPLCPEERTGEGGVPGSCRHGFSNVSPLTFQNEELRNLSLSGHVGFDSLPDQLVNKSTSQGFCFNILCVGK